MKKIEINQIILMLLVSIIASLFVACHHGQPNIAPTTVPATTASAPATTAPPATTIPIDTHIELTPQDFLPWLDEAGELYDAGNTIVLKYHLALHAAAYNFALPQRGVVDVVKDETITIYCGGDNAKKVDGLKTRVQFLYAAAKAIEAHPDCYYTGGKKNQPHSLIFYCQYKRVGCETIEEWCAVPPEEKEAADFLTYEDRTDFWLFLETGTISRYVVHEINTNHWLNDATYIFRAKYDKYTSTLYEEYVKAKGEG